MNLDKTLRTLAKSNYWQTMYISAKEFGFRLFENDMDLTHAQIMFLNYLGFYYSINMDISMGEVKEIVLNSFLLEDAYMVSKRNNENVIKVKNDDKKELNMKTPPKNAQSYNVSWRPK